MKTKGTNSDVAHYWANQVQPELYNGNGSFYYIGKTIYSYGAHFPIATITPDNIVLITTDTYSNTTAKHQSLTRNAIPNDKTVFHVMNVLACNEKQHTQNVEDYIERVNDTLKKSLRARTSKDWLLNRAIELTEKANSYIDKFNLPMPKLSIDDIDTDKLKEKMKQEKIERAKRAKIEREQLLKDNALKIEQWRNGETFFINHQLPCMLRINRDQETIETSQGANIPLKHTHALWVIVKKVRAMKMTVKKSIRLGHYTLNSINKKGDIVVGCHSIKFNELQLIANKLNYS